MVGEAIGLALRASTDLLFEVLTWSQNCGWHCRYLLLSR